MKAIDPPPDGRGPADATLIAVGDVMMHMPQLPGAYDERTKKYDFNSFFTPVKPILEQGDWTLANLETPIAGKLARTVRLSPLQRPARTGGRVEICRLYDGDQRQ